LVYHFGEFELNTMEFRLSREGIPVPLDPKNLQVLCYLLENRGRLVRKQELLDQVWSDATVTENALTRVIARLRKTLEDDSRTPVFIETVPTLGYRFIAEVSFGPKVSTDTGLLQNESGPLPADQTLANAESPVSRRTSLWTAGAFANGRKRWMPGSWVLAAGGALVVCVATFRYLLRPLSVPKITAYTQLTHDGRSKSVAGTDGSRLYFQQPSPFQIAQISVKGGEIAPLRLEIPKFGFSLMDISADGSDALFETFEGSHGTPGQWVVPILGGAPKRLEDGWDGTFSPDGGSVIYSSLTGDIFKVRVDGSDKRKLASIGAEARGFRWSPDGKVIRFSTDEGLWEMSQDGTGVHRLLPGWKAGLPCCGDWTPDGGLFLFTARGQIWALDERHRLFRQPPAAPIQLTSGPLQWGSPIPGKDGKTIFVDGASQRGELSRIDLKAGIFQPFLGGISAEFVSFSPDGKSVAYVAFPECILWRADRDGSNRLQLTQPPDHVVNPRWSPDSKEIVFGAESPDGHDSIHRISAVDGIPLWLLSDDAGDTHDANWSRDGRRVLFAQGPGQFYSKGKRDLRFVDLETRQVSILPGSDGMWSPRWSPNGRYIVGLHGFAGVLPLYDLSTQLWRTLADDGDVQFPSFSRDGRFLYFLRYGSDQGVFRVPVAGGKVERVVNMTDWHLTGVFGYSMSLDPSDAPLVLRDTGSDDIYALTLEEK
jgi:DNA-binding winged helix-turn-helix (wHTH) protein/Tol biopolymer transport system component